MLARLPRVGGRVTASTLDRERRAWRRRGRLDCGCTIPCRCEWKSRPSLKRTDAYADAVLWLDAHGLPAAALAPELAALARRGGAEAALAESVSRRWAA